MKSIDVPGLGKISELPNSPPGERFWQGSFHYREDDAPRMSVFHLCVRTGGEPTPAQVDFARKILAEIDRHVAEALRLLAEKVRAAPASFGLPELTFYEPDEWFMRFAESSLPSYEERGVAVTFSGATPREVEDLSGSPPIE